MKKIMIRFFGPTCFLCILFFILAGCDAEKGWSDITPRSSAEKILPVQETQIVQARLITPPIKYCDRGNGNNDGFYYIDYTGNTDMSVNLRYIDYVTAQDVYLSANPSADHHTPEDPSLFPNLIGGGTAFPAGDYLYVLRMGATAYADQYGENAYASIYQMKLDGSSRRQLYKGGDGENLDTTIAFDGASLYFVAERIVMENNTPQPMRFLVELDTQSGQVTDLCALTPNAYIIGAMDGYLVFQSLYENGFSDDGLPNVTYEIFLYSFETSSLATIKSWPANYMLDVRVYEDYLITGNMGDKTVRIQKLPNGEEISVYSIESFVCPEYTRLWGAGTADGKYYFEDGNTSTLCYTDIFTGEQGHMTLMYDNLLKGDSRPCEIYAQTDTHYLILTGYEMQKRTALDATGAMSEYEDFHACYALITKENFWASVPKYTPITFNE